MTADSIFTELSLVIAIAAGMALVMRLIRQPLMIGHILTGIIVGPSVFHVIKTPATIETFSNIGIALLLFIIGLGLNPKVIREVGKVASLTGVLQVVITALLGWSGALLLGLNQRSAILTGVALSFSSTIIILKLLNDKKEQSRLYGKIAIGILIIQDLLAMVALLLVSAQHGTSGVSSHQLLLLLCKGILIGVPLFYIGNEILPHLHKLIAGSQEFLFLFGIGWGFGAAALFAQAGFSIEVGALLAGVSLASLPYAQEMSARLRPLRDFFIIVFFISLGTRLGFGSIGHLIPLIIFGSLLAIIFKPLIVMTIMGVLGYTKRTSFKTAVTTSQVSEFSLVLILLANRQGLISNNLVAALTLVALITIAVSTYLMLYNDQLFQLFEKYLSLFERRKTHFEQESRHHYDLVLFGYSKGGHEFVKVFRALQKPFVVIDYDPEIIDSLEHQKLDYLYGDAMDIELLEETGLDKTKLIVSTIGDHAANLFLLTLLEKINPRCIVILHAESVEHALELYERGASYVIMPHHIGSEKISAFIRRNGFKKSGFRDYREKHLAYLRLHYADVADTSTS
jgi:Kef-type K+ transport system membrane component KefB